MSLMSAVSSETDVTGDFQRSDKKSRSRKTEASFNRRVLYNRTCHVTHDSRSSEVSARGLTTSFVTDSSRAVVNNRRVEVITRENNDLASRHLSLYHSEARRQPAAQHEQQLLNETSDTSGCSEDEMGEARVMGPVTAVPHSVAVVLRDQLASYQDTSSNAFEYSFFNILKDLGKNCLTGMYSVFLIFCSLLPILGVFLHILRFFLDKLVDLLDEHNTVKAFMQKLALFSLEFLIIFGIMAFIIGSIFFPLYDMFVQVLRKVLFMI